MYLHSIHQGHLREALLKVSKEAVQQAVLGGPELLPLILSASASSAVNRSTLELVHRVSCQFVMKGSQEWPIVLEKALQDAPAIFQLNRKATKYEAQELAEQLCQKQ